MVFRKGGSFGVEEAQGGSIFVDVTGSEFWREAARCVQVEMLTGVRINENAFRKRKREYEYRCSLDWGAHTL